jgi:hypothetical protein
MNRADDAVDAVTRVSEDPPNVPLAQPVDDEIGDRGLLLSSVAPWHALLRSRPSFVATRRRVLR